MTEAETTDDASTPASPFPTAYGSVGGSSEASSSGGVSGASKVAEPQLPGSQTPGSQTAGSQGAGSELSAAGSGVRLPTGRRLRRGPPFGRAAAPPRPEVVTPESPVVEDPSAESPAAESPVVESPSAGSTVAERPVSDPVAERELPGPGSNGSSEHPPRLRAPVPAPAALLDASDGDEGFRAPHPIPDPAGDDDGPGSGWDRRVPVGAGRAPLGDPTTMSSTVALPRPAYRRGPGAPRPAEPGPPQELDRRERRTPDWMARRIVEARAPGAAYELGKVRRWRRRKVKVLRSRADRRLVRRIDTWSVFKVSFVFYVLLVAIVLVAGLVTWSVAQHLGFVNDIQKSVRSLADDKSFVFRGTSAFKYTAIAGAVLGLLGTLFNTVAAMLYNLLSDIFGGLQVIVVSEPD